MHLLDPLSNDRKELYSIFEKLFSKNGIAFLGAGASVTDEKKFLSKEIIDLYSAKINKNFGTYDIIKFVDILQQTEGLHRNDFDKFVVDRLNTLKPLVAHEIFASIPWKLIFTTNFDTLIEDSFQKVENSGATFNKLNVVRSKSQLNHFPSENEITYIKLNGCKMDLGNYPLVFSSEDFKNQRTFYKESLSRLKTLSSEIAFVSFGYSFTDDFSGYLFDLIDKQDFRQRRPIYCVDPYVNEDKLDYLKSRNINIIKMSFTEFFEAYQIWFESGHKSYEKSLQKFINPDKTKIQVNGNVRLALGNNIIQLGENYYTGNFISKKDFYNGEEPNYKVIISNYDIVRKKSLESLLSKINNYFNKENNKTLIPPLLLVHGSFGIGKTTSVYRAIHEFLAARTDTVAFEILKPLELKHTSILNIIKESTATNYIFYCNNIESDSVYKQFNDLRIELASAQISTIKILFISSIRENILEKYKNISKLEIQHLIEDNFKGTYTDEELGLLIDNIKELGLINYRDLEEKKSIISQVKSKCSGEPFLMLYELIKNGEHHKSLEKAYNELDKDVKIAFKITALIHRFNMLCPVSLVKNALGNITWEDFTEKVIKGDGKNLLIQVHNNSTNDEPDIFFRIRHSMIAKVFIEKNIKDAELNSLYKSIFSSLINSNYNSRFAIDLIKNIRIYDEGRITEGQINNYFELAKNELISSSHFMLGYVTNIERNTEKISELIGCLRQLELLENNDSLNSRNHRIIHRKGSVCFKIAKILYKSKEPIDEIKEYLAHAEEWFDIKKRLDPGSDFSYVDYFKLLLWQFKNIKKSDEEKIELANKINKLYDEAKRILFTKLDVINELFKEFKSLIIKNDNEFLELLKNKYQNPLSRVKATLALVYYYQEIQENDKANIFIRELLNYQDDKDVVIFLFKYFGRNLYSSEYRSKFFEITRLNSFLEKEEPLRFYYYNYISEFYNYRYDSGKDFLMQITRIKQGKLNPDFFLSWFDEEGYEKYFEATVFVEKKYKQVKINALSKKVPLVKGNYNDYSNGQTVFVALKFLFSGLQAEIVEFEDE